VDGAPSFQDGLAVVLAGIVIGVLGAELAGRALFGITTTVGFAGLAYAVRGAWQARPS
jgi:hypothetical protein